MVRKLQPKLFNAPWPFVKKGAKGIRKIGPAFYGDAEWPGQHREFPEMINFNSKEFLALGPRRIDGMLFIDYTVSLELIGVYETGYTDPKSGKFVEVPEMIPELIVPDLKGFALKVREYNFIIKFFSLMCHTKQMQKLRLGKINYYINDFFTGEKNILKW